MINFFSLFFLRMLTSTQICLWDTMKIRWTVNWPNTFQLKSIPIHLTVHTQKHTSCCKPTSVMPCCLVQIMQLIQRQCWTKQSEYARYCDAFQNIILSGLLLIVRVLSYFEYRRIWRFLAILWRDGTTWYYNTLFREELDAHNGSHFTELEVNKLKDSGALTGGVYCHIMTSAIFATAFCVVECCMGVILAWLWSLQIVMLMSKNLSPCVLPLF